MIKIFKIEKTISCNSKAIWNSLNKFSLEIWHFIHWFRWAEYYRLRNYLVHNLHTNWLRSKKVSQLELFPWSSTTSKELKLHLTPWFFLVHSIQSPNIIRNTKGSKLICSFLVNYRKYENHHKSGRKLNVGMKFKSHTKPYNINVMVLEISNNCLVTTKYYATFNCPVITITEKMVFWCIRCCNES